MWREVLGDDFLRRPRLSRIYYDGRFFHYPLQAVERAGRPRARRRACCIVLQLSPLAALPVPRARRPSSSG